MSLFHLDTELPSLTGGSNRVDVTQIYPITGNVTQPFGTSPVSSQFLGQGAASGLSTFQFSESAQWWSPALSYFSMQLYVTKITNSQCTSPTTDDGVALCDNFVSTMFSQIKSRVNSRQLDIIDNPQIMDTALQYANCRRGFLKSFGSLTWIAQPFMTRLINTCDNTVSGGSFVEVVFRPSISLFDVKLLPPGAQFNIDFNWASSAVNCFESVYGDISVGSVALASQACFNISVQSFSLYKASVTPGPMTPLPERGVIDLSPAIVNQYFLNGGASLKQNITLPPTTNRVLVVFQDNNLTNNATSTWSTWNPLGGGTVATPISCGIGTGYNPATSFAWKFSSSSPGTNPYNVSLNQLYLTLPELGQQMPQPVYNFGSNTSDLMRAYGDWCHITQGTIGGYEGSIEYGSPSSTQGIPINYVNTASLAGTIINTGDKNNDQAFVLSKTFNGPNYTIILQNAGTNTTQTITPSATICNQMARFGWAGAKPGPIFAFSVVRPEGRTVSMGTINATFSSGVQSVSLSTIVSYSTAIELQHLGNGQYSYNLVDAV